MKLITVNTDYDITVSCSTKLYVSGYLNCYYMSFTWNNDDVFINLKHIPC